MGLFVIENQKLDTRTFPRNRAAAFVPFGGSGGLGKRMFIGMLLALAWDFLQEAKVTSTPSTAPLLANLLSATHLGACRVAVFQEAHLSRAATDGR